MCDTSAGLQAKHINISDACYAFQQNANGIWQTVKSILQVQLRL